MSFGNFAAEVEVAQGDDDLGLAFEVRGFLEGSPVEFDGFGGLEFIGQSFREGFQRRFVARVDSHGLSQ